MAVRKEGERFVVYDGFEAFKVSEGDLRTAATDAFDAAELVSFTLVVGDADVAVGSKSGLLQLKAGASDSDGEGDEGGDIEDEPSDMLLKSLEGEVENALARLSEKGLAKTCPLCPFRSFDRTARVGHHVQRYHVRSMNYCPGGSKQWRLVLAIWDHDSAAGAADTGDYLARSAAAMRSSVKPALSGSHMGGRADKAVRLLLAAKAWIRIGEEPTVRGGRACGVAILHVALSQRAGRPTGVPFG